MFYRFSIQSVASRKIRIELICSLMCSLLDLGVIHACKWPLKNPTNIFIYRFQGIFNANVFGELVVHTESKMIIFTMDRCKVSDFIQVNQQGGRDD